MRILSYLLLVILIGVGKSKFSKKGAAFVRRGFFFFLKNKNFTRPDPPAPVFVVNSSNPNFFDYVLRDVEVDCRAGNIKFFSSRVVGSSS